MFTYSAILTLAPAVRERSWNVDYRWAHWFGFLVWALTFTFIRRELAKRIPDTDPYLLSACGLLCGWGLLTIWRLDPMFGLRQTIWLAACGTGFIYATRRAGELQVLRSQKYILLGAGLALTALTLVLGTNPGGPGPRLWLGCCGVYFQPSEPLKLLLVTYLAAYLADHLPVRVGAFPVLLHTAFVVSLALALLLVQRDLGTASLVILLYAAVLYLATDRARVLAAAALGLFAALWFGYASIEVIHSRLQSWIDPWQDPAGTSYQIVQSLLAIANGGAIGRGPGIGNPGLVPVAISDFVYAALAEETGLAGSVALAALVAVILVRGLTAALNAPDDFRRLLAGAATAYLGMQSLLILGGNLRALPLTGVTLPFMSYGGSSLVTSFSALFLLLSIGANREYNPGPLETSRPYSVFGGLLLLGLALLALTSTWWALLRGPDLLTRTDNARRSIADRTVPRGRLLDRGGLEINRNAGQAGSYGREYLYPELTPVIGYTHTVFGQSGLEASLDEFLRGTRGQPVSRILWEQMVYGTPPGGIDVRLSIDLDLQRTADALLGKHQGAIILMNAASGELLVMASHPWFDPSLLDEQATQVKQDSSGPLINRAVQARYMAGDAVLPLIQARFGVPVPNEQELIAAFLVFGFDLTTEAGMAGASASEDGDDIRVSPLQLASAVASLSNHGLRPGPRLALAANTSPGEWIVLPALSEAATILPALAAEETAWSLAVPGKPYWQQIGQAGRGDDDVAWLVLGTLPAWQGTPLVCVVALEREQAWLAAFLGHQLMAAAIGN